MPRHYGKFPVSKKPVRPGIKKAVKKIAKGVKGYTKNVAGGAKIVGKAIKNRFKK